MVDITALLSMPQRQAAELLGISEGMLCKRYKECTTRKWPFRRLMKLEKKIASKHALLAKTGRLSPSDRLLLDNLIKEKDSLLTPVQIRVTKMQDGAQNKKLKKVSSDEHWMKDYETEQTERRADTEIQEQALFIAASALMELSREARETMREVLIEGLALL